MATISAQRRQKRQRKKFEHRASGTSHAGRQPVSSAVRRNTVSVDLPGKSSTTMCGFLLKKQKSVDIHTKRPAFDRHAARPHLVEGAQHVRLNSRLIACRQLRRLAADRHERQERERVEWFVQRNHGKRRRAGPRGAPVAVRPARPPPAPLPPSGCVRSAPQLRRVQVRRCRDTCRAAVVPARERDHDRSQAHALFACRDHRLAANLPPHRDDESKRTAREETSPGSLQQPQHDWIDQRVAQRLISGLRPARGLPLAS